jgi:cytochrome c5
MSEVHVEEHDSLIKTPQHLIVVVLFAFLIPLGGLLMIASLATGGLTPRPASDAVIAERLKPVGSAVIGEVPAQSAAATGGGTPASAAPVKTAATGSPAAGKKLYDTVCMACHAAGVAGAPKTGDKAAWQPRIAQGKQALYNSALHGKNAMPAKGGMASAPDADVKAAVDYLVSQAK